jgi:hypothetical protein
MSQNLQLDDTDKAMLRKLDDFTVDADNETAVVAGEMRVVVTRPAADRFLLMLQFPGGEVFEVNFAREQLLQQLSRVND